jgi:integrase
MEIDPHHSRESFQRWKAGTFDGVPGISGESSRSILAFLQDMETGRNVGRGTKRGGRGYLRLNALRYKLVFLARLFEERLHVPSITAVTEEHVHQLFGGMRSGTIRRLDGAPYRSVGTFVKFFRAFWRWHVRAERKRGAVLDDICVELDDSTEKPPWVYLTQDEVRRLCDHAKHDYRVLLLFLYDTGIRSPKELVNVLASDLLDDCGKLRIREESSKTFGRTINLMLCADVLREHIRDKRLGPTDQVFPVCAQVVNRYLRRLAARVLGDGVTRGGSPYAALSMYDLRHSSACYWLPRYKSESALKYRFGWKRGEMIHYYTGFLGMRDTITEDDLCTAPERSVIEHRLAQSEREKQLLEEQLRALQGQMSEILGVVKRLTEKAG